MRRPLEIARWPRWGLLPLAVLGWHGWETLTQEGAAPLLFICYTATALLGVGMLLRNPLLAGSGAGWLLAGFPLWLYDAVANDDWSLGCTLFHVTGLVVGALVLSSHRLPRHTWLFAVAVGLGLTALARLFTPEALNVNAAFAVYRGWEGVFPNHTLFVAVSVVGFSAYFRALTWMSGR